MNLPVPPATCDTTAATPEPFQLFVQLVGVFWIMGPFFSMISGGYFFSIKALLTAFSFPAVAVLCAWAVAGDEQIYSASHILINSINSMTNPAELAFAYLTIGSLIIGFGWFAFSIFRLGEKLGRGLSLLCQCGVCYAS